MCDISLLGLIVFPLPPGKNQFAVKLNNNNNSNDNNKITGVVGSNRTQGMDVYLRLFCVCVMCVGSSLATG
jgi:hypothetical protein